MERGRGEKTGGENERGGLIKRLDDKVSYGHSRGREEGNGAIAKCNSVSSLLPARLRASIPSLPCC